MKIKHPEDGDVKIKRKFLIIPCGFDNETRWLEWATVKYRYDKSSPFSIGWYPIEFLNSNK